MDKPLSYMIVDGSLLDFVEQISAYIDNLDESAKLKDQIDALLPKDDEPEAEREQKKEQALNAIFANSHVLSRAPEKEYEPACNLLLHLLTFSSSLQEPLTVLLKNFTNKQNLPQVAAGPMMVLSVLTNLFNILPEKSPLRYNVFSAILSFAQSTDNVYLLSSQFDKLPSWLAQWGVSDASKLELYTKVSDALKESHPSASFNYLKGAVEGSSSSDASLAQLLVMSALNTESVCDLSEIASLPLVQTSLKHTPLLAFLNVVSEGDYATYNKTDLPSQDIDRAIVDKKIKLLALAKTAESVTTATSSRSVSYNDIAKSIDIDVDEVEIWVIDAIRAGIIEGRLNQIEQRLDIHRISPVGHFGTEQWKQIQAKLALWDSNLSNIVDGMRIARESAKKSVAANN